MEIRDLTDKEIYAISGGTSSRWEQRQNPGSMDPGTQRTVGATVAFVGSVISWIPHPVTMWGGRAMVAAGGAMGLESLYN